MNYAVAFSRQAQRDLHLLNSYLSKRFSSSAAAAFEAKLLNECSSLSLSPVRGTGRPDLGSNVRSIGFDGRTTILFKVDKQLQRVAMVAVKHRGRIR